MPLPHPMLSRDQAQVVREGCLQNLAIVGGRAEGQFSASEVQDAYFALRLWICNATDALTAPHPGDYLKPRS